MKYQELMSMSIASLLDASMDDSRPEQERLQASEAVLARLPEWEGDWLGLSEQQRRQLRWLVDWSEMKSPWPVAA